MAVRQDNSKARGTSLGVMRLLAWLRIELYCVSLGRNRVRLDQSWLMGPICYWVQVKMADTDAISFCFRNLFSRSLTNKATESPFQRDEAHFSETGYFDELAEDDKVAPATSQGLPLPIWEDLMGEETRADNSGHASTGWPRKGHQSKERNKRTHRGNDRPGKVQLADGRRAYLL